MAKRLLSLLCAVVMVLGMIPAVVHAAETTGTTPVFSVEETWATTGNTVEVEISLSNNPGILGGTLVLSWAEKNLTVTRTLLSSGRTVFVEVMEALAYHSSKTTQTFNVRPLIP